jgi:hypothetical protein
MERKTRKILISHELKRPRDPNAAKDKNRE